MIQNVPKPTQKALVLICRECGKKFTNDPENNPSVELTRGLKGEFKEKLGSKIIRPILTSCLDVCPKEKIAMAIIPMERKQSVKYYEYDIKDSAEMTYDLMQDILQVLD